MRSWVGLLGLLLGAAAVADVGIDPTLNAYVQRHGEPRLESLTQRVHVARSYDAANFIFVLGDDGIVVIDTSWHVETASQALADLRAATGSQLPIAAVVYSHGHFDHTGGVRAFVPKGQEDKIPIYASSAWRRYQSELIRPTQPMLQRRVIKQFDLDRLHDGEDLMLAIGRMRAGASHVSYLPPTHEIAEETELLIAGVRFVLRPLPSELDDEMLVWLPDEKVAYGADAVGDMFPWLQTPRLEISRSAEGILRSAEVIAAWKPDHLVFGHGATVKGDPDEIQRRLAIWRSASRTIIDQTVYHLNQGRSRDETAARVRLPRHLADEPMLRDHYHRQAWVVKGLYTLLSGWYGDDALEMIAHPPADEARRWIALAGGHERVLENAKAALERGDHPWAAQLATSLLLLGLAKEEATRIKAAAFRGAAARTPSDNERNYLATEAKMLEGTYRPGAEAAILAGEVARQAPVASLVELLSARFDLERGEDVRIAVNLHVTDRGETFGVDLDRGVLLRQSVPLEHPVATVAMTHDELLTIVTGAKRFADLTLPVEGDADQVARLFEILGL